MVRATPREPIFNVPGVTLGLLIALCALHFGLNLLPEQTAVETVLRLAFIPARYSGLAGDLPGGGLAAITSLITHMAVHADLAHLVINSAWLLAFGTAVERRLGAVRFILFTLTCGVAGALAYLVLHMGEIVSVVGASGAVSGLMGGALRFFFVTLRSRGSEGFQEHSAPVPLMPLPTLLKDRQILTILIVWLVLNFVFGLGGSAVTGGDGGVAWEAHVGGFLMGLLGIGLFDREAPASPGPSEPHEAQPPANG